MCVQCMAGAATAMGGAAGTRAWLATQPWVSPKLLRRATVVLLSAGVLGAATLSAPGSAAPERSVPQKR